MILAEAKKSHPSVRLWGYASERAEGDLATLSRSIRLAGSASESIPTKNSLVCKGTHTTRHTADLLVAIKL